MSTGLAREPPAAFGLAARGRATGNGSHVHLVTIHTASYRADTIHAPRWTYSQRLAARTTPELDGPCNRHPVLVAAPAAVPTEVRRSVHGRPRRTPTREAHRLAIPSGRDEVAVPTVVQQVHRGRTPHTAGPTSHRQDAVGPDPPRGSLTGLALGAVEPELLLS
jgi:hypothetical protein